VYRQGLALRYGRTMQCIAGIHYNFSLSDKVWRLLKVFEKDNGSNKDFQSEAYIALIRNFHRYSWLLMYLFGASPAVDKQFLRGRPHQLETFSGDTLFLPYATSLRMSDLGYQNNAQSGLMRPYNTLFDYMKCLARAVRLPYPPYEALGLKRGDQWVQINTNILQVENEFYATIRPKRVINTGERPLEALCARGVQYIEVRCMDIDPFNPIGISEETSRFLDAFLLFCALDESPLTNEARTHENQQNFALTVKEGRRPGLKLQRDHAAIDLRSWADQLLHQIEQTVQILDEIRGDKAHAICIQQQKEKIDTPDLTPSFRVLDAIGQHQNSFIQFGLFQSKQHAQAFKQRALSNADSLLFEQAAQHSLDAQAELEQKQTGDFDTFITDYRSRTPQHLCCENE
jgi:glutamate--cysteine ligase